jgi:hypothetical protein
MKKSVLALVAFGFMTNVAYAEVHKPEFCNAYAVAGKVSAQDLSAARRDMKTISLRSIPAYQCKTGTQIKDESGKDLTVTAVGDFFSNDLCQAYGVAGSISENALAAAQRDLPRIVLNNVPALSCKRGTVIKDSKGKDITITAVGDFFAKPLGANLSVSDSSGAE